MILVARFYRGEGGGARIKEMNELSVLGLTFVAVIVVVVVVVVVVYRRHSLRSLFRVTAHNNMTKVSYFGTSKYPEVHADARYRNLFEQG